MVSKHEQARLDYVPRRGDHIRYVYKEPDPAGVIEKSVIEGEDWHYEGGRPMTVGDHEATSGDRVEILRYAACTHYCSRCGPSGRKNS